MEEKILKKKYIFDEKEIVSTKKKYIWQKRNIIDEREIFLAKRNIFDEKEIFTDWTREKKGKLSIEAKQLTNKEKER